MPYENSKIHVGNLEKEKRSKDNIDQLILDLHKISTQNIRHPQVEVSVDHQEHAPMECNTDPPMQCQNNAPDAEPSNTETVGTIPKKEKSHRSPYKRSRSEVSWKVYPL